MSFLVSQLDAPRVFNMISSLWLHQPSKTRHSLQSLSCSHPCTSFYMVSVIRTHPVQPVANQGIMSNLHKTSRAQEVPFRYPVLWHLPIHLPQTLTSTSSQQDNHALFGLQLAAPQLGNHLQEESWGNHYLLCSKSKQFPHIFVLFLKVFTTDYHGLAVSVPVFHWGLSGNASELNWVAQVINSRVRDLPLYLLSISSHSLLCELLPIILFIL